MAAARAPVLPFEKLAAAFGSVVTAVARGAGGAESFRITTPLPEQGEYRNGAEQANVEVELLHGAPACLILRAHEDEPAPLSVPRKNVIARQRARLVYPPMLLRRVTPLDRMNTLFALRFDVRSGDPAFDRAVTIEADLSDEIIAQTLVTREARAAVLAILAAGFTIHLEERAIRVDLVAPTDSHFTAATLGPILAALGTLIAHVPRADPGSFSKRPQLGRAITAAILVTGLVATGALAPGTLDDPGVPVRPLPRPALHLPALAPGILAGSIAFVLAFVLLRWQLKRKNASTDLPLVIALFVVSASLGVGLLDAGNRLLDEAPLVVHETKVASKSVGRSRKSGQVIEWSLVVPSWRPGATQLELSVNGDVHRTVRVGDTLKVSLHPGFFDWEWGAVVENAGGGPITNDEPDEEKRRAPEDRRRDPDEARDSDLDDEKGSDPDDEKGTPPSEKRRYPDGRGRNPDEEKRRYPDDE